VIRGFSIFKHNNQPSVFLPFPVFLGVPESLANAAALASFVALTS
jgi:hypothetical protein